MTKQEMLSNGVEFAKFDFTKTLKKSIIFTRNGIISSVLAYKSQ